MNTEIEKLPLQILWEDAHILIINKPAEMLSQAGPGGQASVETAVRAYLKPDDPGAVYLGAVHRLDRPVSGVLAWAKTTKAARRLATDFENRTLTKEYWAIIEATETLAESWDDWLSPLDEKGIAHVVSEGTPRAKHALTNVSLLSWARFPAGFAGLELRPGTGRTHQLRVQAAARGMAIVGDARYGSARVFSPGIALHARGLSFTHPTTRVRMRIVAPVPRAWVDFGFAAPEGR